MYVCATTEHTSLKYNSLYPLLRKKTEKEIYSLKKTFELKEIDWQAKEKDKTNSQT